MFATPGGIELAVVRGDHITVLTTEAQIVPVHLVSATVYRDQLYIAARRSNLLTVVDEHLVGVPGSAVGEGAFFTRNPRNATVQASLENADNQLIPGMAVKVEVSLSEPREVLAVPGTAIIYAPFGDTVYVVEAGEKPNTLKARQQFIRTGEQRGDFVEVLDGIKAGQKVVAAGAFKLFNGQAVVESSNPAPEYQLNPKPADK